MNSHFQSDGNKVRLDVGERFLKILPYKEWEVFTELRKEQ